MHPQSADKRPMLTFLSTDDFASDWARQLEQREAFRLGISRIAARKRVASRLGIAAGTLENLSRRRIKGVREAIYTRLRSAVIHEIQREIAAQTNELNAILGSGRGPGDREVQEVASGLARLRSVMSGGPSAE